MAGLLVDIDPHGRLIPQSDDARRGLADRAGRFALLPSAPDLLVLRRTPAAGDVAARPRCALAGDLSALSIGDLIAFMQQSRLTGVLTVASGAAERAHAFRDGEVRSVRSSAAGERLGDVAVRLGFATEAQVAQAGTGGKPIGKPLVDMGFVSATDLWKCLHEQVATVFQAILMARSGTFHLIDEDVPERGAPLTVNTQTLLMDGIRRIDEMSLFRARIPGPDARLYRRNPRRPISLKPSENQLLALVDGRSVAEIARAAHVNEFDATKVLFHLAEAGYVEASAGPAPIEPGVRLRKVAEVLDEALRGVAGVLPDKARPGYIASLRTFLADGGSPHAPVLGRLALSSAGGLDVEAVVARAAELGDSAVASLDSSGDRAALLLRALRDVLFFGLFVVGERLTPEQDEALSVATRERLARAEALF